MQEDWNLKIRCCMDGDKTLPSQGGQTETTSWDREDARDEGDELQTTTIDIPTNTITTMDEGWKCAAKGGRHPKGMSEPVSLRRYHHHTKLRSSLVIVITTACTAVVVLLLLLIGLLLRCLILLFLPGAKLEFVLIHVQRRGARPSTRARS